MRHAPLFKVPKVRCAKGAQCNPDLHKIPYFWSRSILTPPQSISSILKETTAVVNAVAAGLGLSLVSRFAVKNRINAEDIAVLNIEGLPLERGLYFVTRKDQVVSPLVEAFYNFFKDYLQVYTTH
jgi:DNA-binding transcriptional LysR family regulator